MKGLILCLALIAGTTAAAEERLRMAVTTSFHNSGLSDVLLPEIAKDLGIDVQLLVVGTGQAMRLAEAGDVDAILTHSPQAEKTFVAEGHATHRREIMYNDFVLVGPGDDPAGVRQSEQAIDALRRIAENRAPFVSRGDDSGTHKMEQGLWEAAALDPEGFGQWYRSIGAGMGAALNTASAMGAYVLTDRASWLNFGNRVDLAVLFESDPMLFNQYAFLPVNPTRHPHVAHGTVARLEEWLTSSGAADLVNGYRIDGQQLFFFNAAE